MLSSVKSAPLLPLSVSLLGACPSAYCGDLEPSIADAFLKAMNAP
jgi:hypothetical protein